ncbi:hypothetical protein SASPL_152174 [Salvia splendens]|uniref:Retrotransposon Copia-like N-terminal domain-containing protein n=1 Tax=Salvia splendens TaxID=180675 RepID=A0A8X8W2M1_SALSN|nr:hypothetical protein SASPL_152174 [Salvia splendens]
MAESDNSGGEENAISPFSHSITVLTQTHPIAVKLTKSSYLVWRQQLMSTIRAFDLEPFLFEDQVVPQRMIVVEGTSKMKLNPEYPPWKKQDQLLASWLQSSLSENILALMDSLLAAIGCKIPENDQILYALNGLGPQYDPVMVAISALVDGWIM